MSVPQSNASTDVVELCALLQCLGFNIKSLESIDVNASQDAGAQTVVINCQVSGFHVIMENFNSICSCPIAPSRQNSGFWEVSGVTGGKQYNKESGSTILGSLPKTQRERLTNKLQDIVKCIKEHNESDADKPKEGIGNKSNSMLELKTPEKREFNIKNNTPTRYRSLDALPAPPREEEQDRKLQMCQRQSTYTISSTPGSSRRRNKTSSPIQAPSSSVLETLIVAEKTAEELRNKLANVIKEFTENDKLDSSMSSLALDVSKISVLKGPEASKLQFASSPNLSALGIQDDFAKRLKRTESASTSNLAKKPTANDGKASRIRRLSPNLFKLNNTPKAVKTDKDKSADNKSGKFNSLFKSKVLTPVRVPKSTEASPNLSASRKKYSNVKSTIPRPASKKE